MDTGQPAEDEVVGRRVVFPSWQPGDERCDPYTVSNRQVVTTNIV